MADNFTVVVSGGATRVIRAIDNTSVWTMAHAIVDSTGVTVLDPVAEDAAHTTGDVGLPAMVVRQDTPANLSGTDGDYEMLSVSAGRLWCSSTITAVVPGTAATNLGKAEDGAHTSADVGVMALAVRTDTAINRSGSDGDYEPLQISAGRLWCSATVDAALPAGTNAIGKLAANTGVDIGDVDVTSIVPGTGASNLGKAEDAAHTSADVGVMALGVRNDTHTTGLSGTDGDYTPIGVDASGKIGIRGTFAEDAAHTTADLGVFVLAVANATHTAALVGTDGDYTPIAVDTTGKVGIRGTYAEDVAHTTADLGLMVLAKRTDDAAVSSGTDGDYSTFNVNAEGRLYVYDAVTTSNGVSSAAVTSADASATVAVTDAPSAGKKLVITELTVSVGSALTVTFEEETTGTDFLKLYMAANTTQTIQFKGKQKLATADKKLNVTTSGAGNISVRVSYFSEA